MSVEIKDDDAAWDAMRKVLSELDGSAAVAGFRDDSDRSERDEGGLTNAQVASIHVFGVGVPKRDFMRPGFDQNEKILERDAKSAASEALLGQITPEKALDLVGTNLEDLIVEQIQAGNFEALAPSTVAKKGRSDPLLDTEQMVEAVEHWTEGR